MCLYRFCSGANYGHTGTLFHLHEACATLLPVLFMLSSSKQLLKCLWWCFCYAGGAVFDASQYAFFGKDAVQEVDLGGLEDNAHLSTFESNEEEFFFNREKVHFQSCLLFFLKVHVARMCLKYIHVEFTILIKQHVPSLPFSLVSHTSCLSSVSTNIHSHFCRTRM